MMRNRAWRGAVLAVACLVLAGLLSPGIAAQDTMSVIQNAPGFSVKMTYSNFGNGENVNVQTGALIVTHASAVSLPQNHGGGLSFSRVYNDKSEDKLFTTVAGEEPTYGFTGKYWRIGFGRVICRYVNHQTCDMNNNNCFFIPILHYFYVDESGAEHALFAVGGGKYYTNDSSYLRALFSSSANAWTIYYADGSKRVLEHFVDKHEITYAGGSKCVVNWAQEGWYATKLYDSYGNLIQVTYNPYNPPTQPFGDSIATITDQLGRVVMFEPVASNDPEPFKRGLLHSVSWLGPGGQTATETYNYDVKTDNFNQPNMPANETCPYLVKYTDPAGLEVQYVYQWQDYQLGWQAAVDQYALSSIGYPTGAVATYGYDYWNYLSLPPDLPWRGDPKDIPQEPMTGTGVSKRTVVSDGNSLSWTYWRGGHHPSYVGNYVVINGPDGRSEMHAFYYEPICCMTPWKVGREMEVDQYAGPIDPEHPPTWTGLVHSKAMSYEWTADGDAHLCLTDNLAPYMPAGWPPPPQTVAEGGNARVYQTVETEYDASSGAQLSQRTAKSTNWDGYGHYTETDTTGTGIVGSNHKMDFSQYDLALQTSDRPAYILTMKTASGTGWGQNIPQSYTPDELQQCLETGVCVFYQNLSGVYGVRYYTYNSNGALLTALYKKPQYTAVAGAMTLVRTRQGQTPSFLLLNASTSMEAGDVKTSVSYDATGNISQVSYSGGDAPQGGTTMTFTQTFVWDHGMVSSASTPGLPYTADLTRTIDSNTSLIMSTTDPNGLTTHFDYDILGRLTKIKPPGNDHSTYIAYPTKVQDGRTIGHDILFYQGPSLTMPTDMDGFDDNAFSEGMDTGAAYAHYIFDDLGRLVTTRTLHPDGKLYDVVTAYDPWGASFFTSLPFMKDSMTPSAMSFGSQLASDSAYSASVIRKSDGNLYGSVSSIYPNATWANPVPTTQTWPDPFNRVLYSFKPDGSYVSTVYTGLRTDVTLHGIQVSPSQQEDSTTTYTKDILGRLLLVQPPVVHPANDPNAVNDVSAVYSYDALGNMIQTDLLTLATDPTAASNAVLTGGPSAVIGSQATQKRIFTYDGLGRLRSATNPENGTTNFTAYAPLGKLLVAQDANGAAAPTPYRLRSTYDAAGRLLATNKVKASDGSLIQALIANTYDKLGGVAQGASLGQLVQAISYQLMQSGSTATTSDSYGYNTTTGRVSSLTQSTNAGGWAETSGYTPTYDLYGQVTDQALPSGTIHNTFSHGAVMSRILSGDSRTLLDQFVYNEAGSLSSVRLGQSYAQSAMFDETLRPIGFALGTTSGTNLFALGSYADPTNPATRQQHELSSYRYQYDGAGNITSIGETSGVMDSFTYDRLSRLTAAVVYKGGSAHGYGYTYDPYGNLTQRTESANGQANVKSYLTTNCLIGGGDAEGYLRELMFNATIATANGAPTNRLASVQRGGTIGGIPTGISQTNTAVSYDPNGNMTNDGQHVYKYDALNRQIAVFLVDGTTKLAESVYNTSGERVGMVSYQGGAISSFTKFLRDGSAVVYEKSFTISGSSHTDKSEKTYLYAAGMMALTKDRTLTGTPVNTYSYYGVDHLGTVRFSRTIDQNGNTVSGGDVSYAFEPFGVMLPGSQPVNGNTHLYTGQERDALADGSNMDYMHFRFFSASMGRFQKPDSNFDNPGANPQGWNLYSYVKGNPVNFNDPTGHQVRSTAQTQAYLEERKMMAAKHNDVLDMALEHYQEVRLAIQTAEAAVNDVIKSGGVAGSITLSQEFLNQLQTNSNFRAGFTAWLATDVGTRQWNQMKGDSDSHYQYTIGSAGAGGASVTTPNVDPEKNRWTSSHNPSHLVNVTDRTITVTINVAFIEEKVLAHDKPDAYAKSFGREGIYASGIGGGRTYESLDKFYQAAEAYSAPRWLLSDRTEALYQSQLYAVEKVMGIY